MIFGRFWVPGRIRDGSGKKPSATEKMVVLGAQMELEARSPHISHLRDVYDHVESSGTSSESVSVPPNRADGFFPLYAIFLAYVDSIWWIRCIRLQVVPEWDPFLILLNSERSSAIGTSGHPCPAGVI